MALHRSSYHYEVWQNGEDICIEKAHISNCSFTFPQIFLNIGPHTLVSPFKMVTKTMEKFLGIVKAIKLVTVIHTGTEISIL